MASIAVPGCAFKGYGRIPATSWSSALHRAPTIFDLVDSAKNIERGVARGIAHPLARMDQKINDGRSISQRFVRTTRMPPHGRRAGREPRHDRRRQPWLIGFGED